MARLQTLNKSLQEEEIKLRQQKRELEEEKQQAEIRREREVDAKLAEFSAKQNSTL